MSMMNNDSAMSQGSAEPSGFPGGDSGSTDYSPSEYASGFLKDVPDEHRGIVEQYVKKWDSGVTKRFQELNDKLRPYEDLGLDEESLEPFAELWETLNNNPKELYDMLGEALGISTQQAKNLVENGQQGQPNQQQPLQSQNPLGNENLGQQLQGPPELVQKLEQQEALITTLAQIVLGNEEQGRVSQEDQQFDAYLNELRDTHGDFDEEWVVMKIANGMDGESAVQAYQQFLQEKINAAGGQPQGNPIPLLTTNNGIPGGQQSVKDLSRQDTKKLVVQALQRTASANQ